jgi:hypothetical protein
MLIAHRCGRGRYEAMTLGGVVGAGVWRALRFTIPRRAFEKTICVHRDFWQAGEPLRQDAHMGSQNS